jgi:hypothetical protein
MTAHYLPSGATFHPQICIIVVRTSSASTHAVRVTDGLEGRNGYIRDRGLFILSSGFLHVMTISTVSV